jgi:ferredoxin-NADP reductase
LALTVERIEDGEVSAYLTGELRPGDELELRGPVGGHFSWRVDDGGPLLLIAGGVGLVPLMAMLRHRAAHASTLDARLLLSVRSVQDILYRDELAELGSDPATGLHYTITGTVPPGWTGFIGRLDEEMLQAVAPAADRRPRIFVCGPTAFVERAADLLVALQYDTNTIHAERFGPTGG